MKNGTNKKYSFKSVGLLEEEENEIRRNRRNAFKPPIGIKTPIEFSYNVGGLFKMHRNLENQIADNFRNLISTNHGERLGHYDFGANLTELTFELGSEDIDSVAMRRISKTTQKYMPFIQLDDFEPFVEREDNEHVAKIGIRVSYSVPTITMAKRSVEIILYVAG